MSAWIVSKEHIDALVHGLTRRELVSGIGPTELGRTLWTENVMSIHYRYPDTAENDSDYPGPVDFAESWAQTYSYDVPAEKLSPDALLKQVHCYDYQTCEHPQYQSGSVKAMITCLEYALIDEGANPHSAAYESAPWGVD